MSGKFVYSSQVHAPLFVIRASCSFCACMDALSSPRAIMSGVTVRCPYITRPWSGRALGRPMTGRVSEVRPGLVFLYLCLRVRHWGLFESNRNHPCVILYSDVAGGGLLLHLKRDGCRRLQIVYHLLFLNRMRLRFVADPETGATYSEGNSPFHLSKRPPPLTIFSISVLALRIMHIPLRHTSHQVPPCASFSSTTFPLTWTTRNSYDNLIFLNVTQHALDPTAHGRISKQ